MALKGLQEYHFAALFGALHFRSFHAPDPGYPGGNPNDPEWTFVLRINFYRLLNSVSEVS